MENKEKNNPIITTVFILMIAAVVGFVIYLALNYAMKLYNKYWKDNNLCYWFDLNHFDTQSIDPDDYISDDKKLRSDVLSLLECTMHGENGKREELEIKISESEFRTLDPNSLVNDPVKTLCGYNKFLILESGNKAIVIFDYSSVPKDLKEAEKFCLDSYKIMPCNRVYLEKENGVWTVDDVYIVM